MFEYTSDQVHSIHKNGKGYTRRNTVSIKNSKGFKAVEIVDENGKVRSYKKKALTAKERKCIKRCEFVPGLFKDCTKAWKHENMKRLNIRKTRRHRK